MKQDLGLAAYQGWGERRKSSKEEGKKEGGEGNCWEGTLEKVVSMTYRGCVLFKGDFKAYKLFELMKTLLRCKS